MFVISLVASQWVHGSQIKGTSQLVYYLSLSAAFIWSVKRIQIDVIKEQVGVRCA